MARKPSSDPTKTKAATKRGDDSIVKSTTYLPLELARRLRVYCATEFSTMSDVTAQAIDEYLAKRGK